mmetsp:Transcript_2880/g.4113  ORF Transcript_2880/g.4113 Transcript_2880/m.4113 type:complete len:1141 (+) Transcript_2880:236-3658(+)
MFQSSKTTDPHLLPKHSSPTNEDESAWSRSKSATVQRIINLKENTEAMVEQAKIPGVSQLEKIAAVQNGVQRISDFKENAKAVVGQAHISQLEKSPAVKNGIKRISDFKENTKTVVEQAKRPNISQLEKTVAVQNGIQRIRNFKEDAKAVVGQARRPEISKFHEWDVESLKQLLVQYNVQVRGSAHASHETLVRICEDVFRQVSVEHNKALYSVEDITRINSAARRIQEAYIRNRNFQRAIPNLFYNDIENAEGENIIENGMDVSNAEYVPNSNTLGNDFLMEERPSVADGFRHASMLRKIKEDDMDGELETEWRKPSWRYAKKYEALNRPHRTGKKMSRFNWKRITLGRHCTFGGCGEQLDLWNEGQMSEFAQFGSGITNYFKFLKWCCWVMLILSFIHLPVLIINMYGTSIQYESSSFALTTFGNLGSADEVTSVHIPGCNENEYQFNSCIIEKDELATYYALLDASGTIVVIIAWIWLKFFERKEVDKLNRSTVTASDYTIRVLGIPSDATEKELAAHFAAVTDEAVAEVHLAYANAKEINLYFKRGKLMRRRYDCVQRVRYLKTQENYDGHTSRKRDKKLKKLLTERSEITSLIQLRDDERMSLVNPNPIAIQAFVTFETENGFIKAISAYQLSWIRSICCLYPRRLRFKGGKLQVSEAPEPSTIIWENLEITNKSRSIRKCLTTSVATLAIFLSVIFTFLARDFQTKALERASKPCPDGFFDMSRDDQYQVAQNDYGLAHCYCSTMSAKDQWNERLCSSYIQDKAKASAMSSGAGFMVVFMNAFFTWLMDSAGSFEKPESLDRMQESNMARVFFLKFVNTGCLVLLYNQKWIQKLVGVRFDDAPDFNVDWYETGGVNLIFVMVLNVITPHLGSFFSYWRYRCKIKKIEKRLTEAQETNDKYKVWYTQEDLNREYIGPSFHLNYRYTQILINFYICWMYAISMPIMPAIGALSFYVSYWVDKFLFCNYYCIPPRYSDEMGKTCTKLIGCCVVLHLTMSLWMMGNGTIFHGESVSSTSNNAEEEDYDNVSIRGALSTRHGLILFVLMVLFVGGNVYSRVLSSSGEKVMKCLRCLVCSSGSKARRLTAMMSIVQVSYSNARQRGIIKGLATYNILQNPKYQEAFAISQEFAMNHRHLK